jgi:hypothetical protein
MVMVREQHWTRYQGSFELRNRTTKAKVAASPSLLA